MALRPHQSIVSDDSKSSASGPCSRSPTRPVNLLSEKRVLRAGFAESLDALDHSSDLDRDLRLLRLLSCLRKRLLDNRGHCEAREKPINQHGSNVRDRVIRGELVPVPIFESEEQSGK